MDSIFSKEYKEVRIDLNDVTYPQYVNKDGGSDIDSDSSDDGPCTWTLLR
jgi:hypothetical protein